MEVLQLCGGLTSQSDKGGPVAASFLRRMKRTMPMKQSDAKDSNSVQKPLSQVTFFVLMLQCLDASVERRTANRNVQKMPWEI